MSSSSFQSLDDTEHQTESQHIQSLDTEEHPLDVLSSCSSSSSSSAPAPRFPKTSRVKTDKKNDGFTEEDKADFLEIFKKFDKHGTGVIPSSELAQTLAELYKEVSPEDIEMLIEKFEIKKYNNVDCPEFIKMICFMVEKENLEVMERAFDVFDKNDDGFITIKELREVLNNIGEPGVKISDEDFNNLIDDIDVKEDKVDYEKFAEIIYSRG